jgi:branched-chain amino acid transport system substrate-binding protein
MAIIRKLGIGERGLGNGNQNIQSPIPVPQSLFPPLFAFLLLAFAFFLSACTPTGPVAKIALLAPFEGIYRQEGYDGLAVMRAAIAEQCPAGTDVLPLALDTSRGVARAAQKALADPSVAAIVGPYWAMDGPALASSITSAAAEKRWFLPYAPTDADTWAVAAVDAASDFARTDGRALLLAGVSPGWPQIGAALVAGPDDVPTHGAVLWLGDAAAGADFALALWNRLPGTPFGLYGAGAETFRLRAGGQMGGPVFLVGWVDSGYTAWAANHSPNTPSAYTIYRQTADALCFPAGEISTTNWEPTIFRLGVDGSLVLWTGR